MDSSPPPAATHISAAVGKRSLLRRLLETLGALALALALAEIGARLFLRIPPRLQPAPLAMKINVPEADAPGMANCLKPGSSNSVLYTGTDGTDHTIDYRINRDGFRDRVYPPEPEAGTYRIAIVGDSVTFGVGVPLGETVPKILEHLFQERLGAGRVEVLNCGVYSFNTRQQVAHLAYRVLHHHPDLVVFLSTVTDASGEGVRASDPAETRSWEARWIQRLGLTSGRWEPDDSMPLGPSHRRMLWLRNHSALADFLANKSHNYLRGRLMTDSYTADWVDGSPGEDLVDRALGTAKALSRRDGFDLLVCMYPILSQLDHYPLGSVHAELARIAATHQIEFVDLLPALAGMKASALHAHQHDKHPNGVANRHVAEFLYPELENRAQAAF